MFNHHTQEPQLQMFRMDEDGISVAQKAIRSLRRTANVSLAHAVEAALDYLNNMSVAASSYELLLISDGHDSGGFKGAWNNWGKFHDVLGLIEETTNDPGKKQIRMHGFAVGTQFALREGGVLGGGISTYMNSMPLCGRSRSPCLARAAGCVPLQGCCLLVPVPPAGCPRVALFVTETYVWSSMPLPSHLLPALCADRLLYAGAIAQACSGAELCSKKVARLSPGEIFAARDQQLH